MPTLILGFVCIILIFVLYIVSGGWRKYGGVFGIFRWLRHGAKIGSTPANPPFSFSRRDPLSVPNKRSGADEEAIQVLREIYQEFEERHRELASRMKTLERANESLQSEIDALKSRPLTAFPGKGISGFVPDGRSLNVPEVQRVVPEFAVALEAIETGSEMERQDKYFAILDLLDSGFSEAQIAEQLGVTFEDVAYVQRIMAGPQRGDNL